MSLPKHHLELLAPARDASIAREAILHGADAVYIGGPSFGARHNAENSVADIAELVKFAHLFHARVFVTLNTILHDDELEAARALIQQLYEIGVDALIVQDMGIMELDIPPIEIHASTQTDIRTLERAKFLDKAGFSQLVLARELNLQEIRAIYDEVESTLEFFIHGALCVAFSGQCNISHAQTGRSANRGDCSQACRLPYTLKDDQGRVVAFEKHLLSMKDNNQSANLSALVDAGVRSFKIEGRYKDVSYVKNITAYYRQRLDGILAERPDLARASSGRTAHFFVPDPDKTFHRGSTDYFVTDRKIDIGAFDSPTFTGLAVGEVLKVGKHDLTVQTREPLSNGDGLNVLIKREVVGFRASVVEPLKQFEEDGQPFWQYRVEPNEMPAAMRQVRPNHPLNRNLDHNWQNALLKTSAERRIGVRWLAKLRADELELHVTSEEGAYATATLPGPFGEAKKPEQVPGQIADLLMLPRGRPLRGGHRPQQRRLEPFRHRRHPVAPPFQPPGGGGDGHARGLGRAQHGRRVRVREHALDGGAIGPVRGEDRGDGLVDAQEPLIQGGGGRGARDLDVDERGPTSRVHVHHGDPAAGEPRVHPEDPDDVGGPARAQRDQSSSSSARTSGAMSTFEKTFWTSSRSSSASASLRKVRAPDASRSTFMVGTNSSSSDSYSTPASSRALATDCRSEGSERISKDSPERTTSSASAPPSSTASSRPSSVLPSAGRRTRPLRSKRKETEPESAMVPPLRVTAARTSAAARFLLSVRHSTSSAEPWGPRTSYMISA